MRNPSRLVSLAIALAACTSVAVGVGCALKKDDKKKNTSTTDSANAVPDTSTDLGTDFNTGLGTDGMIEGSVDNEDLSAPHYAEIDVGGGTATGTALESVVDEGAWRLACTTQGTDVNAILEVHFNETFAADSATPGPHVRSIKTGLKCIGIVRLDFDIDKSSTQTTIDVIVSDKTGKALKQGSTAPIPFTANKVGADGSVTTIKVDLPLTDVKS